MARRLIVPGFFHPFDEVPASDRPRVRPTRPNALRPAPSQSNFRSEIRRCGSRSLRGILRSAGIKYMARPPNKADAPAAMAKIIECCWAKIPPKKRPTMKPVISGLSLAPKADLPTQWLSRT